MSKIKVAIAGLGNCASSLVQGIEHYKKTGDGSGFISHKIGDYSPNDIEFVAVFDISDNKVGKDISEAIFESPNCTYKICDVERKNVQVKMGPILDGVTELTREKFNPSKKEPVNVVEELKKSGADVLVNYMPVGSQKATEFYANCALEAGIGFINAMPVFIASNPEWERKFKEKNLPIIGDDIKSQVGATIIHRALMRLFADRGVKIKNSYQLNFGGNTDFLNMLDRTRLNTKKVSKTESVQSQLNDRMSYDNLHIGPSDYVPFLEDRKICFIRIEGEKFGGAPIIFEGRLQVEDSPNSAGVIADAIRLIKVAKDKNQGGVLKEASAYLMKHPPIQMRDSDAMESLDEWIKN
jgi:myo-inositol-1-phosphate synthase